MAGSIPDVSEAVLPTCTVFLGRYSFALPEMAWFVVEIVLTIWSGA